MITNQETIINDCRTVQYTKTFGKIYMLFFCNDRRIHHACFYRSKWGARKSIRLIYCFLNGRRDSVKLVFIEIDALLYYFLGQRKNSITLLFTEIDRVLGNQ